MDWLNDLVWIGNTLYPRWFVLAVFGASGLFTVGVISSIIYWCRS